jgi:nucleoid-associated protein YgaU
VEQLEKATIVVRWSNDRIEQIPVQFNPTEFTLEKGTQLAEVPIPGLDAPLQQFVRGQAEKLTVDLFFDTTDGGMGERAESVTRLTDKIYQLAKIEPTRHAPPVCTLVWSDKFPGNSVGALIEAPMGNQRRHGFQCLVEQVRQKFTLFSPQGVPLRATLSVTFREYKTLQDQLQHLNLSSPDRTHSHVLEEGETLAAVAVRHYNRPGDWRRVADANAIEDPRRLTPGMFLTVVPIS